MTIQNWQPLASEYLDREQPPHLRMSSAGRCPRALAYAATHLEESDPPDEHSLNRMAMGHMAELLIVRGMHRRGWETGHTVLSGSGQLELEVEVPNTGMVMRGHPDGICRHPEFTRNHWVTLECKSMSIEKGREVERQGVAPTYPHYMFQISMYGRRMHEMELVSHPERGVFAMMDRDGRPLPPERVTWDTGLVDGKLAELTGVVKAAEAGEVPERPYPQSSSECQYCSYHTLCWGEAPQRDGDNPKPLIVSENPEVRAAAERWAEFKPRVDTARDFLQAESNSNDRADIMAAGVIGGYFEPRELPSYDAATLERLVPADILKKCLSRNQRQRPAPFWVRKVRT